MHGTKSRLLLSKILRVRPAGSRFHLATPLFIKEIPDRQHILFSWFLHVNQTQFISKLTSMFVNKIAPVFMIDTQLFWVG